MGYVDSLRSAQPTTIEGVMHIDPPLNEAENAFLTDFVSRRGDAADVPGILGCPWTPNAAGTHLVWTGPDTANATAWLRYLVDTFLSPKDPNDPNDSTADSADDSADFSDDPDFEIGYVPERATPTFVHPDFAARHRVEGHMAKFDADGSRIAIYSFGTPTERPVCGPTPSDFAVCVLERGRDFDLDREYDSAFDLGWNQFTEIDTRDPDFDDAVEAFIIGYPTLDFTCREGRFIDATHAITVTPRPRGEIWVDLDGPVEPATLEARMRALVQFCRDLACHLNWVSYVPATRTTLRPTTSFADRLIASVS